MDRNVITEQDAISGLLVRVMPIPSLPPDTPDRAGTSPAAREPT